MGNGISNPDWLVGWDMDCEEPPVEGLDLRPRPPVTLPPEIAKHGIVFEAVGKPQPLIPFIVKRGIQLNKTHWENILRMTGARIPKGMPRNKTTVVQAVFCKLLHSCPHCLGLESAQRLTKTCWRPQNFSNMRTRLLSKMS